MKNADFISNLPSKDVIYTISKKRSQEHVAMKIKDRIIW